MVTLIQKLKKNKIAELKSRQGVRYPNINELKVLNMKTKKEVKHNGKELGEILFKGNTIMMGYHRDKVATKKVFKSKKIPFRSFEILKKNEETIGELFTFFMLETILLGRLMRLDPFNQPAVELIKKETKKLLH